jgi:hypothetical protein
VFVRERTGTDGCNVFPLRVNHSHPFYCYIACSLLYLHSQISKDQTLTNGRLISKLAETSSSLNPRWLVAFDDESRTEEDMYESSFGKIIGKAAVTEPADSNKNKTEKNKETVTVAVDTPKTTARNGSPVASPQNSAKTKTPAVSPIEMEQQAHSNINSDSSKKSTKKQMSFQTVQDHHTSDSSTLPSDAAKAAAGISSREQRSNRRQAAIMEEVAQQPPTKKKKVTGQYNEEVVKIQMLTGTLYLYRGLRRRAEFVRKY